MPSLLSCTTSCVFPQTIGHWPTHEIIVLLTLQKNYMIQQREYRFPQSPSRGKTKAEDGKQERRWCTFQKAQMRFLQPTFPFCIGSPWIAESRQRHKEEERARRIDSQTFCWKPNEVRQSTHSSAGDIDREGFREIRRWFLLLPFLILLHVSVLCPFPSNLLISLPSEMPCQFSLPFTMHQCFTASLWRPDFDVVWSIIKS